VFFSQKVLLSLAWQYSTALEPTTQQNPIALGLPDMTQ